MIILAVVVICVGAFVFLVDMEKYFLLFILVIMSFFICCSLFMYGIFVKFIGYGREVAQQHM